MKSKNIGKKAPKIVITKKTKQINEGRLIPSVPPTTSENKPKKGGKK